MQLRWAIQGGGCEYEAFSWPSLELSWKGEFSIILLKEILLLFYKFYLSLTHRPMVILNIHCSYVVTNLRIVQIKYCLSMFSFLINILVGLKKWKMGPTLRKISLAMVSFCLLLIIKPQKGVVVEQCWKQWIAVSQ